MPCPKIKKTPRWNYYCSNGETPACSKDWSCLNGECKKIDPGMGQFCTPQECEAKCSKTPVYYGYACERKLQNNGLYKQNCNLVPNNTATSAQCNNSCCGSDTQYGPPCSGNGKCLNGICICNHGWDSSTFCKTKIPDGNYKKCQEGQCVPASKSDPDATSEHQCSMTCGICNKDCGDGKCICSTPDCPESEQTCHCNPLPGGKGQNLCYNKVCQIPTDKCPSGKTCEPTTGKCEKPKNCTDHPCRVPGTQQDGICNYNEKTNTYTCDCSNLCPRYTSSDRNNQDCSKPLEPCPKDTVCIKGKCLPKKNPCNPNPCGSGNTCSIAPDGIGYSCKCNDKCFSGKNCKDPSVVCNYPQHCQTIDGRAQCVTTKGPCDPSLKRCLNGKCIPDGVNYTCNCDECYTYDGTGPKQSNCNRYTDNLPQCKVPEIPSNQLCSPIDPRVENAGCMSPEGCPDLWDIKPNGDTEDSQIAAWINQNVMIPDNTAAVKTAAKFKWYTKAEAAKLPEGLLPSNVINSTTNKTAGPGEYPCLCTVDIKGTPLICNYNLCPWGMQFTIGADKKGYCRDCPASDDEKIINKEIYNNASYPLNGQTIKIKPCDPKSGNPCIRGIEIENKRITTKLSSINNVQSETQPKLILTDYSTIGYDGITINPTCYNNYITDMLQFCKNPGGTDSNKKIDIFALYIHPAVGGYKPDYAWLRDPQWLFDNFITQCHKYNVKPGVTVYSNSFDSGWQNWTNTATPCAKQENCGASYWCNSGGKIQQCTAKDKTQISTCLNYKTDPASEQIEPYVSYCKPPPTGYCNANVDCPKNTVCITSSKNKDELYTCQPAGTNGDKIQKIEADPPPVFPFCSSDSQAPTSNCDTSVGECQCEHGTGQAWPFIGSYIAAVNALVINYNKTHSEDPYPIIQYIVFDGEECQCGDAWDVRQNFLTGGDKYNNYILPGNSPTQPHVGYNNYPGIEKETPTNEIFTFFASKGAGASFNGGGTTTHNKNDIGLGEVYWNVGQSWPCLGNESQWSYYTLGSDLTTPTANPRMCTDWTSHTAFSKVSGEYYANYLALVINSLHGNESATNPLTQIYADQTFKTVPLLSTEFLYRQKATTTPDPQTSQRCTELSYYGDAANIDLSVGQKICGTFDGFSVWEYNNMNKFITTYASRYNLEYVGIYAAPFLPKKWMPGQKFLGAPEKTLITTKDWPEGTKPAPKPNCGTDSSQPAVCDQSCLESIDCTNDQMCLDYLINKTQCGKNWSQKLKAAFCKINKGKTGVCQFNNISPSQNTNVCCSTPIEGKSSVAKYCDLDCFESIHCPPGDDDFCKNQISKITYSVSGLLINPDCVKYIQYATCKTNKGISTCNFHVDGTKPTPSPCPGQGPVSPTTCKSINTTVRKIT